MKTTQRWKFVLSMVAVLAIMAGCGKDSNQATAPSLETAAPAGRSHFVGGADGFPQIVGVDGRLLGPYLSPSDCDTCGTGAAQAIWDEVNGFANFVLCVGDTIVDAAVDTLKTQVMMLHGYGTLWLEATNDPSDWDPVVDAQSPPGTNDLWDIDLPLDGLTGTIYWRIRYWASLGDQWAVCNPGTGGLLYPGSSLNYEAVAGVDEWSEIISGGGGGGSGKGGGGEPDPQG